MRLKSTYSNHRGREPLASESYPVAISMSVGGVQAVDLSDPIAIPIAVSIPVASIQLSIPIPVPAIRISHAHLVARLEVDETRMARPNPDDKISAP